MCPNELRKDMLMTVMLELLINKHNILTLQKLSLRGCKRGGIITKVMLVIGLVELEERGSKPGISGGGGGTNSVHK
eukprot:15344477-Ditylum_brightwellii.AAC.1